MSRQSAHRERWWVSAYDLEMVPLDALAGLPKVPLRPWAHHVDRAQKAITLRQWKERRRR